MFGKTNIDMRRVVPSSKITLKMTCLEACDNDIDAAERLYKYIASDLKDLPDMEPMRPGMLQQADQVIGWFGQHRDEFSQVVSVIQSLRGGKAPISVTDIPPIPNATSV